ncbi:hypothetical protein RB623_21000 [Mesorhizobium sp. LHD-90]|uniref:hypothetical protein n=1 Tax=Mesorhizobium sp. LHD-90 TaxID=3071414 RepID=UPI0027DF19F2|nr:hypothetical protein [Mesorhizobium sp. LHD-90]MDQ6436536.1 hypothetical protein [Mesorhizobium sp. LHD-90]
MTANLQFPNDRCERAWAVYVGAEKSGSRAEKLSTLDALGVELIAARPEGRRQFVESWCLAFLDGDAVSPLSLGNGQWMRLPLFRAVFRPVLESGRLEGRAGYARWSAQLHGLFSRPEGAYRPYEPSAKALLREALQVDPGDIRARALLIEDLLSDVDYYCHELPAGLLVKAEILLERVSEVEDLLSGTIWAARSHGGLSALRRVAAGDWSDRVLDDAFRLLSLRFRIAKALLPKTRGSRSLP